MWASPCMTVVWKAAQIAVFDSSMLEGTVALDMEGAARKAVDR